MLLPRWRLAAARSAFPIPTRASTRSPRAPRAARGARRSRPSTTSGSPTALPESGITFVHHAVDDVRKSYRPVHYDHGNGIAAADVDGDGRHDLYFVNQARRQRALEEPGRRPVPGHHRARRASAWPDRIGVAASFADVDNDGDPDLFVTTVRGGNVAVRERRPRALPRHHARGRGRLRRATPRARSSSTTTTTGGSICSSATSAATRATRRGRRALSAACRTRSPATSTRTAPSTRPSTAISAATVPGRPEEAGLRPRAGAATPASPT